MRKLIHICEVCGKSEILTSEGGYNKSWDYPPKMGTFKVVSPRTCGNCSIKDTLWWAICCEGKKPEELTKKQLDTLERIGQEPEILYIDDEE